MFGIFKTQENFPTPTNITISNENALDDMSIEELQIYGLKTGGEGTSWHIHLYADGGKSITLEKENKHSRRFLKEALIKSELSTHWEISKSTPLKEMLITVIKDFEKQKADLISNF